jgi:hypothetical protein
MRAGLLVLALAASGCNDPIYLHETAPIENAPVAADSGMTGYAPASVLYVLPVRKPTADEKKALVADQKLRKLPMAEPWAQLRDFDIEIQYSVRNVDTMEQTVVVTLDGGNEFGDYVPSAYIDPRANVDEQTQPPHLVADVPLTIAPGATATGVFREDNLHESAIDLEAITRYPSMGDVMATPFEVIEHLSTVSPIGLDAVPAGDVTPAQVRYAITVNASGHVVMDFSVRVRDHHGKLGTPGAKDLYVSTAATLTPPAAPPATTTTTM